MLKKPHHLFLRANTWMIRVQVPKDVQNIIGQKELLQSTKKKEHQVEEALLIRDQYLATWKLKLLAIRRGDDLSHIQDLEFTSDTWSGLMRDEASLSPHDEDSWLGVNEMKSQFNDGAFDEAVGLYVDGGWQAMNKEAQKIGTTDPHEAIRSMNSKAYQKVMKHMSIVKGETFASLIDQYLETRSVKETTKKNQDFTKKQLKQFAEKHHYIGGINKVVVNKWKEELEKEFASNTINSRLGALSGYWEYLTINGFVDDNKANPFKGLRVVKKVKSVREHFTMDEARLLIEGEGKHQANQLLLDFIKLGLLTGCRVIELCSLRLSSVKNFENIGIMDITEDMTKANSKIGVGSSGVRKIPITNKIKPILDRLIENQHKRSSHPDNPIKGYLFDTGFNQYGDITGAMGKRFGTYKSNLGFPKNTKVAHSFRHTANNLLSREGVISIKRDALFGWSGNTGTSMSDSQYLDQEVAYPLDQRKEDLEKLGNLFTFI